MTRRIILFSVLTVLAMGLWVPAASSTSSAVARPHALKQPSTPASVHPDFNGDGFADLAVGASSEDVRTVMDAGQINVLYGSASGPNAIGRGDQGVGPALRARGREAVLTPPNWRGRRS